MLHKSIVLAAAFAAMAAAIPVELAPERLSECPENENYNGRECVCDRGFERSREGGCVKPTAAVRCGRNEVPNPRGGCECDRGFDMTREGCKPSDDDDDDDDAPLKNMRGDSWCEKKKDKNARICAKQNKRGAFRYRDEWCAKMCASAL